MEKNNIKKPIKYIKYKRGQLVLVNFSPSIGSEMAGKHFAIVLTKRDSEHNAVLTVIPLSSKFKHYYLNLGNIVDEYLLPKIRTQQIEMTTLLNEMVENFDFDSPHTDEEKRTVFKILNNLIEMEKISKLYNSKSKNSYALVQSITTISKFRITKPSSKYDPIKKLVVGDEVLDKLDVEIIKKFTSTENNDVDS